LTVPIDLKEFGNKLQRRRNELQLSEAEVGASTGITAERVAEFEKGATAPTGDEVLILADFFKCDYRYLISNEKLAASEQTESLYRMYGNEFSKADRRAILEFLYLCECEAMLEEELGRVAGQFTFTPTGTYFKGHAEDAAAALRRHFSYADLAVPSDVYADFRKIGFHLFRRRLQNSKISGITIRHPQAGTCILVNYDEDVYRQRFTAAHEGAHGIIDRGDDVVVSFAVNYAKESLVEIRANTFASRYLLPPSLAKSIPVTQWDGDAIIKWASHFKVSTKALAVALKEAGVIDDGDVVHLSRFVVPAKQKLDPELVNLSDKALARKRELLEWGLSSYYVGLCFEAVSKGLISAGRAAEMLLIDDFELPEIAALFGVKL
jgi:Zn-dependent peptidase ImmA (M78 family)